MISFKRITSSGNFIPEIDGLRFIAIFSVVIYHYWCLIAAGDHHVYNDNIDWSFIKRFISHGNFGVELFFVISGFILGLPFCKYYIFNENKINLKSYFTRRLTRLEPPYILSLIIFALAGFFVLHQELSVIVKSFFSSFFYIHNFITPGAKPLLNGVSWSLEVEVQFYILAPILSFLFFRIKKLLLRRAIMISAIIICIIVSNIFQPDFVSIYNYLHYFLLGFLLVDFYLNRFKERNKISNFNKTLIVILLFSCFYFEKIYLENATYKILWEIYQLGVVFIFYYFAILNRSFTFLSKTIITNIGGMCYTIYLLHYPLIAFVSKIILPIQFSEYSIVNYIIYSIIYTVVIALVSMVFYLFVEKPCMDKNWINKLTSKFN